MCIRDSVCSHYELDAREYMSDPSRPKPYQPRGALDGNVCDTKMAKKMSFCLRYGDSCGMPFFKDKFCDEHREWAFLRPYLHDRLEQPWTNFTITNDYNQPNKNIKMNEIRSRTKRSYKGIKNFKINYKPKSVKNKN